MTLPAVFNRFFNEILRRIIYRLLQTFQSWKSPKYLTKEQIIDEVNKHKNLHKKFKIGSWDYFAAPAGVFPISKEPSPKRKQVWRYLFTPDSVQKLIKQINKNGNVL